MILFTFLLVILLALFIFAVLVLFMGGVMSVIIFSDVIVCIFIMLWIIKRLIHKK